MYAPHRSHPWPYSNTCFLPASLSHAMGSCCTCANLSHICSTKVAYLFIFLSLFKNYIFPPFLGLHLQHMEVPRLGVTLELSLPAYATATATPDPSHSCKLHHCLWQRWILNPLSEARDRTHVLMDTGWVRYCWAMTGTLFTFYFEIVSSLCKSCKKSKKKYFAIFAQIPNCCRFCYFLSILRSLSFPLYPSWLYHFLSFCVSICV